MTQITSEQRLTYTAKIVDGRGRPAKVDGVPQAFSSDETVVTVSEPVDNGADGWTFEGRAILPGTARIVFQADADLGEGVTPIVAEDEIEVTIDPRTEARTIQLVAGEPEDA